MSLFLIEKLLNLSHTSLYGGRVVDMIVKGCDLRLVHKGRHENGTYIFVKYLSG